MRFMAVAAVTMGLLAALLIGSGRTSAAANAENASCMGLGSSFYAHFAPQQRAQVAHLIKEYFAEAPGSTTASSRRKRRAARSPRRAELASSRVCSTPPALPCIGRRQTGLRKGRFCW
jgi:hypothetical protein